MFPNKFIVLVLSIVALLLTTVSVAQTSSDQTADEAASTQPNDANKDSQADIAVEAYEKEDAKPIENWAGGAPKDKSDDAAAIQQDDSEENNQADGAEEEDSQADVAVEAYEKEDAKPIENWAGGSVTDKLPEAEPVPGPDAEVQSGEIDPDSD